MARPRGAGALIPHVFGPQYVSGDFVNLIFENEACEYFEMKDGVKQGRVFKVTRLKMDLHSQLLLTGPENELLAALWQEGHDEWKAYSAGKREADSEKIFSVSKNGTQVIVSLSKKKSSSVNLDFTIKGNWSKRNCSIYLRNSNSLTVIAQISLSSENNDNVVVNISRYIDYAFVVALIAILDAMKIDEPVICPPVMMDQPTFSSLCSPPTDESVRCPLLVAQPSDEPAYCGHVMGPQYITNGFMNLVFEKLEDDEYAVIKESSNERIFKLKSDNTTFQRRWMLVGVDKEPVAMLQKKHRTVHARWYVYGYFGESEADPKMIFSACKNHMIQPQTDFNVVFENEQGMSTNDAIDYKIKGSWTEKNCTIRKGDSSNIIAQVRTQENKDRFVVEVYPEVDYAFVTVLVSVVVAMKSPCTLNVVAGRFAGLAARVAGVAVVAASDIMLEALL